MNHAKSFGERVAQERREKSARERRDVLQREIAKAVKTTTTTVSRWEAGLVIPGDEMLRRLADYFRVTPAWLRYGQAPKEAPAVELETVEEVQVYPRPKQQKPAKRASAVGGKRRK